MSFAKRVVLALVVAVGGVLTVPQMAQAHVERASYWPDPAPDCSVSPCAGGTLPTARTLASAVSTRNPYVTRVVCQPDSLTRLKSSITQAKKVGYVLRPTQPRVKITTTEAGPLLNQNKVFFKR